MHDAGLNLRIGKYGFNGLRKVSQAIDHGNQHILATFVVLVIKAFINFFYGMTFHTKIQIGSRNPKNDMQWDGRRTQNGIH